MYLGRGAEYFALSLLNLLGGKRVVPLLCVSSSASTAARIWSSETGVERSLRSRFAASFRRWTVVKFAPKSPKQRKGRARTLDQTSASSRPDMCSKAMRSVLSAISEFPGKPRCTLPRVTRNISG